MLVEEEKEEGEPPALVPEFVPFSPFVEPAPPPFPPEVETEVHTAQVPEAELVREVSVGGVTRLQSGDMKRTYSGEALSQCPT